MSFASSLHSPPSRKTSGKEPSAPSSRIHGSPHDDPDASPPDDEEEGWSKVRSSARGNTSRVYDRRTTRGERRLDRDPLEQPPRKSTAFRNPREGESQNWRSERPEGLPGEQMRDGRRDGSAEFLEGGDDDFGERGGGEHSAEEFQAWLAKMRGQNKQEDTAEKVDEATHENGISTGISL
jgi:hypothetical protein